MSRWPTGLDPEVIAIRERNKERIIACLIKKIERRHSPSSRFQFAEGISYEEKEARVRGMVEYRSFPFVDGDQESYGIELFGIFPVGRDDELIGPCQKEGDALFVTLLFFPY